MEVQAELNVTEITQSGKARDRKDCIERTQYQAEQAWTVSVSAEADEESDDAAEEMKEVVSGWKSEVEHFVAEEASDADHDQDRAAEDDISFCNRGFHGWM